MSPVARLGILVLVLQGIRGETRWGLAMVKVVKESESSPLWVWLALGLIVVGSAIYVVFAFAIEHMMTVMQ